MTLVYDIIADSFRERSVTSYRNGNVLTLTRYGFEPISC